MSEHLQRAREGEGEGERELSLLSHWFDRKGHERYTLEIIDPASIISGNKTLSTCLDVYNVPSDTNFSFCSNIKSVNVPHWASVFVTE